MTATTQSKFIARTQRVLDEIDVLPVVHPGPFEVFVVDLKAQRMDEVQSCPDGKACPSDVSRVVGNQRGAQHDVEAGVADVSLHGGVIDSNRPEDSQNGRS